MIDQVKQRIDELEMMNEDEVAAQEVKGEATAHTLTERLLEKFGDSEPTAEDKSPEDDTMSVAKSVLEENKDIGAVHSTKSVAARIASKKEALTMVAEAKEPSVRVPSAAAACMA